MSGSRLMTEDMVISMIQKATAENDSKFKIMEKKFDDRIKLLEIRVELLEEIVLDAILYNISICNCIYSVVGCHFTDTLSDIQEK